jgi:hypothetical protein
MPLGSGSRTVAPSLNFHQLLGRDRDRNGPYKIDLADIKAGKKFRDFGLDQQAEIVRMEYDLLRRDSSWHLDQNGNVRKIGALNPMVNEWYDATTNPMTHWSYQQFEALIDLEHQLVP